MTIANSPKERVNVAGPGRKPDNQFVLEFADAPGGKSLVLKPTNGKRIAKALGSADSDDWVGKKIVLYRDENVEFGGEIVGGIRARKVEEEFFEDKIPF